MMDTELYPQGQTPGAITERISDLVLRPRSTRSWFVLLGISVLVAAASQLRSPL